MDKCLETDPLPLQFTSSLIQTEEIKVPKMQDNAEKDVNNIDFLKQRYSSENSERMCPMCGKLFCETTTFNEFQEHVESHFIDDSDTDYNSIERNFELISHAVGDF